MSDAVIKVKGLSKRYRIGQYVGGAYQYRALRDVLTDAMHAPFRRLRVRSEQQAVGSNPRTDSHQPSANFIWALKDVSFQVKQGEVIGIIGGNGAGKSTLLKVLSRITEPTEGRAEIKGRLGSLLEVGTGFHPELTGRENIYLSGAILGMTKKEISQKFDDMVDFSGIEKFIDTPVKRYSSGMLVRLGFAVAAHLEPEILLVDEVLAVGDAQFQKKCLGKMGEVASEGRTVLFVSHNMAAISNLCGSAILLQEGKIIKIDEARSVVDFYLRNNDDIRSLNGEVILSDILQKGNNSAKIDRIRLLNSGEVRGVFDVNEDITVQIDFTNYENGNELCFYLHVYDENKNIVFTAANLPSLTPERDPWFNKPFPKGKYRTRCFIPRSYLNTGDYGIDVIVQYNITQHAAMPGLILNFTITDELGSIKELHQQWLGVVRPKLQWKTEALS